MATNKSHNNALKNKSEIPRANNPLLCNHSCEILAEISPTCFHKKISSKTGDPREDPPKPAAPAKFINDGI
ncbi:MAG TPA: hypothetical protein DD706_13100 [Nitrospiraceae bacterium]|nr:hypothetical protein [Nitrospiraceae bacterium]